jgi:hypothetical protein
LLGIGPHPQPESVRAAERIEAIAARFDLGIATNEWFVDVADDDPLSLEVNPDGTIAFDSLHAPTTRRARAHSGWHRRTAWSWRRSR